MRMPPVTGDLASALVPLHRGFDGLSGRLQSTPIATLKPTFSTDDGTGASRAFADVRRERV